MNTEEPMNLTPAETSWWLDEALAWEKDPVPCPPLREDKTVDVAIVGGGFTGLWTSLALLDRNPSLSIALIEATICGAGASGKNGGVVHGYWSALPRAVASFGQDGALALSKAGSRAQDGLRAFAAGRDLWWREGGNLVLSTTPGQDGKLAEIVRTAEALKVSEQAIAMSRPEVQALCSSPVFRTGVFFPETATVHPGRLARSLRAAAIERGVQIHEFSPMLRLEPGTTSVVHTPEGRLLARDVVLATNSALAAHRSMSPHLAVFSSYALMTEPAPHELEAMGWRRDQAMADARMFLHYFRKTPDGRVLMGSGSGPIAFGGRADAARLRYDVPSAQRTHAGLRRLLPGLRSTRVEKCWGGPIDVSADRFPFIKTLPNSRVHYACGFSGHGVNATSIAGNCLASTIVGLKDAWTALPLCTREVPRFPPEPLRYLGGGMVRKAIIACEEAEERGTGTSILDRSIAALPKLLGIKVGTR